MPVTKYTYSSLSSKITSSSNFTPTQSLYSSVPYVGTRVGERMPKHKLVIANGGNATTVLRATEYGRRRVTPVYASYEVGSINTPPSAWLRETIVGIPGNFSSCPGHSLPSTVPIEAQALSRAYAAVKQQQQHFSGMTFLGELRESIGMLRSPFKGVRRQIERYFGQVEKLARSTRYRGTRQGRARFVDAAASAWLECAFGISPLVADAKKIAETLARFEVESSTLSRVSGRGKGINVIVRDSRDLAYFNFGRFDNQERIETSVEIRYLCGVSAERRADFGSSRRLLDLLGLTALDDFVPTLYELVPYSFLVDYFTNLGNVIETGCQSLASLRWVCRTQRNLTTNVVNFIPTDRRRADGYRLTGMGIGSAELFRKDVLRDPYQQLPSVPLVTTFPGSAMKAANVLALFQARQSSISKLFT